MGWVGNPMEKIRKISELNRTIILNTAGAAMAGAGALLPYVKSGAPTDTLLLVNTLRAEPGDSTPGRGEANGVTNAFYWKFHEYGTSRRPAHPFVRPAVDHHDGDVSQAMELHMVRQTRRITT